MSQCCKTVTELEMNEVKRRATTRFFEQEIWNNLSKQNSFQDRLLDLKCHKLGKDEDIAVRAWDSEKLLILRRNKKLRELINSAEACKRRDHDKSRCHSQLASSHHLPTLVRRDRPSTTGQMSYLGLPSGLSVDRRSRSHSDLTADSVMKHTGQEDIYLPAVSGAGKARRSSHSACSRNTSLSDSEINKQRIRKPWTRPAMQLHRRDDIDL